MDGLKEKVFELASQDAEFAERLAAAETPEAAAGLLREKGLDIAAEDLAALAQPEAAGATRLSDDELDAVAGGGTCKCVVGGSGSAGLYDEKCTCVVYGIGHLTFYETKKHDRCECLTLGSGCSYDPE